MCLSLVRSFSLFHSCNLLNDIGVTSFFFSSYPKVNIERIGLGALSKDYFYGKISFKIEYYKLQVFQLNFKKIPHSMFCTTVCTRLHDHLAIYCVFNCLKCQLIARNGIGKEIYSVYHLPSYFPLSPPFFTVH